MVTTPTPSTTAKAPASANNGAGEGGEYASVRDGVIYLLDFGVYAPVSRWEAVGALMEVQGSPFASSQERARQIQAALKETMQ